MKKEKNLRNYKKCHYINSSYPQSSPDPLMLVKGTYLWVVNSFGLELLVSILDLSIGIRFTHKISFNQFFTLKYLQVMICSRNMKRLRHHITLDTTIEPIFLYFKLQTNYYCRIMIMNVYCPPWQIIIVELWLWMYIVHLDKLLL